MNLHSANPMWGSSTFSSSHIQPTFVHLATPSDTSEIVQKAITNGVRGSTAARKEASNIPVKIQEAEDLDSALPPPPSPFSQLFPSQILAENGVNVDEESAAATNSSGYVQMANITNAPQNHQSQPNLAVVQSHSRPRKCGVKQHFCTHCSAGFTRLNTLNKHVREKHTQLQMKHCPFPNCQFQTINPNTMIIHKRNHQHRVVGKPLYFCKSCKVRYATRRALLQHLTRQHASDASLIGMGQSDSTETELSASATSGKLRLQPIPHKQGSSPVKIEPATTPTSETFTQKITRSMTRSSSTTGGLSKKSSFSEPSVSPSSSSKRTPKQQEGGSPQKKKYECDRCKFTARTFQSLFTHRTKKHPAKRESAPRSVNCVYCWRLFRSANRLVAHMKANHLDRKKSVGSATTVAAERPRRRREYGCRSCDFSTTTKRVFTAHKQMHEEDERRRSVAVTAVTPNSMMPLSATTPSASTIASPTSTETTPVVTPPGEPPHRRNGVCSLMPTSSLFTGVPWHSTLPPEVDSCIGHLNEANTKLLQLCRRRDDELQQLRRGVMQLLRLVLPEDDKFLHDSVWNCVTNPENVDKLVADLVLMYRRRASDCND